MSLLSEFLVQSVNGILIAMAIYLIASGLSLVFGVLGVLNFAHGSFYMLAAFLVFTVTRQLLQTVPGKFWLAVVVAPVVVALIGLVVEMGLLRFIYKADPLYQLLLTYGLVLVFSDGVKLVWGAQNLSVRRPPDFEGSVAIFGRLFPSYSIWVLLPCSILTMIGLSVFLNHTSYGRIVRAATQDREMVGALGINVRRLYTTVFVIGSWLAGLSGVIAAPMGAIYPGMDFDVIIDAFIVVVIGGLGSTAGTVLGALIFGLLRSFGILIVPQFETVFIFLLMAVVLIVRPQGLLGRRVVIGH